MKGWVKTSYLGLVYLFLYTPLLIVVALSFNNTLYSQLWHGFTWHWYWTLFHDKNLAIITLHSLTIGSIAATIATLLGMLAAVALYRYRFLGKQLLDGLIFMLIIIPDLVIGIALLLLFNIVKLPLGYWSLQLAHISFCLPFATIIISSRLVDLNKHLIEAGRDLGAGEYTLYKRILFPLLLPSLAAAWLMSFTLSFDDVIISYFVSGPTFQILPLKIYSAVKLGIRPEINALCTILLITTMTIAISAQAILRKKH